MGWGPLTKLSNILGPSGILVILLSNEQHCFIVRSNLMFIVLAYLIGLFACYCRSTRIILAKIKFIGGV